MFANFWWLCHFWQLFVTFVILLFYCPVMMSSCHIVIFTSCHSVLLSSCQSGILSICQFVNFPASELLSLRTFRLAHLKACELVLHIIMISFGGFLAECLPCYDHHQNDYHLGQSDHYRQNDDHHHNSYNHHNDHHCRNCQINFHCYWYEQSLFQSMKDKTDKQHINSPCKVHPFPVSTMPKTMENVCILWKISSIFQLCQNFLKICHIISRQSPYRESPPPPCPPPLPPFCQKAFHMLSLVGTPPPGEGSSENVCWPCITKGELLHKIGYKKIDS